MKYLKYIIIIYFLFLSVDSSWADNNLPQFDTSKYPRVLFWLFLNLAILFIFIKYIIIPKIHTIQNTRGSKLISNLEKTLRFEREYNKITYKIADQKQYLTNHKNILWDEVNKKTNLLIKQKNLEFNDLKTNQKKVILNKIKIYKTNIKAEKKEIINQWILLISKKIDLKISSKTIDNYIEKYLDTK